MSVNLFKTDWLERLTYMPLSIFLPFWGTVLPILVWASLPLPIMVFLYLFLCGLLFWTFIEYVGHRFLFHIKPKSSMGKRIIFLIHGNHHELPSDSLRNMMPLIVTIPISIILFSTMEVLYGKHGSAVFLGFLTGYVGYDLVHYYCHQRKFNSGVMRLLRRHHLIHHYAKSDKNFAVSNTLWDYAFKTKSAAKKTR